MKVKDQQFDPEWRHKSLRGCVMTDQKSASKATCCGGDELEIRELLKGAFYYIFFINLHKHITFSVKRATV